MVRQAHLRTQAQFRRGTYSFPCYRSSTIVILFLNLQYLPHSCHNSIRACISRFVHVDLHTPNRLIVCQYSDVNGVYNCHLYATVYVNDKSALALLAHVSSSLEGLACSLGGDPKHWFQGSCEGGQSAPGNAGLARAIVWLCLPFGHSSLFRKDKCNSRSWPEIAAFTACAKFASSKPPLTK